MARVRSAHRIGWEKIATEIGCREVGPEVAAMLFDLLLAAGRTREPVYSDEFKIVVYRRTTPSKRAARKAQNPTKRRHHETNGS
jgi:hypothetical protein